MSLSQDNPESHEETHSPQTVGTQSQGCHPTSDRPGDHEAR